MMKQRIISMLVALTVMTGASAQRTELIGRGGAPIYLSDSLKVDSMYNYWNNFVAQHPKDNVAWRNLFEICSCQEFKLRCKDWETGTHYFKENMVPLLERIKKAIPGSYTAYYCEYEGMLATTTDRRELTADSAIVLLPKDAPAGDYELWMQYLIPKRDTVRMTNVLTQYYESGQYPEESLQYHFNELQGMEEGGIYIGAHEGDVIGKMILQYVLGVHKDKILYDENAAMVPEYVQDVFGRIGIPFNEEIWNQLWSMWQDKTLTAIMHYIFDHSKRPVYLSAHDIWQHIIGQGLPDELKACFYNEGLTMRYSTKPYDNRAVKRRNLEQRYRLEYLRMSFHPEMKNTQRFSGLAEAYAMNYMRLLHDQLPYYKRHNLERYQWLYDIFTDIIERLEKENYDVDEFKGYLK